MAIDSVLNPAGIAQKLSIPQLQKAIQDGTIPPYIGVPMLQQKVQMEQRMRNASAQPQQGQPSIAQQVMAEAQGVSQLPSNLPAEYAGGGIVAFARGGIPDIEADQFDEDSEDELNDEISRIMRQMQSLQERAIESSESMETPAGVENLPRSITSPGFTSTEIKKGVSVKEGDQPARTVEERQKSVTKPAGLEELLSMIEQKESGGRRYDKSGNLLTSPKGAMGEMQVMPMTARDPGFGIRPAEGNNPDELRRVGREYFGKMLEKYGDPKLAAIAYNMGPGATDKWLMAGADPSRLPDETRKYAQGFAEGGIASIKRFQYGGISGPMPYSIADLGLNDLTRMARMGDPMAVEELARRRSVSADPFSKAEEAFRSRSIPTAGTAPPAAPAAPAAPAGPAAPVDERSLLRKGSEAVGRGAGSFFGDLMRTGPLARGLGIGAFLTPSTTNANEQEELERRRLMPPTITTTEKLTPMSPRPVKSSGTASTAPSVYPQASQAEVRKVDNALISDMEIGAAQDFEDLERGLGMTEMARQKKEQPEEKKAATVPAEDAEMKDLRDRIKKGYAKLEKQEESDKYLALLSAGLGMMSGTSPFGLSNIGRGGMMGVQSLMQSDASRAAQEAKLLNAQLYAKRYEQLGDIQKAQLEATQAYRQAQDATKREIAEASMQQKREALQTRQMGMYANQLKELERLAQNAALAREKGAILPEQKEAIAARASDELRNDPGYRRLYKLVHGFDPMPSKSGNTLSWDQLGK